MTLLDEALLALRELLEAVEASNRTKRGDFYYERKASRAVLARADAQKDEAQGVTEQGVRVGHVGTDGVVTLKYVRRFSNGDLEIGNQYNVMSGDLVLEAVAPMLERVPDGYEQLEREIQIAKIAAAKEDSHER